MKRMVYIEKGLHRGRVGEVIGQGTRKRLGKMYYFVQVEMESAFGFESESHIYYWLKRPPFKKLDVDQLKYK
jgi:hypothetical protein